MYGVMNHLIPLIFIDFGFSYIRISTQLSNLWYFGLHPVPQPSIGQLLACSKLDRPNLY